MGGEKVKLKKSIINTVSKSWQTNTINNIKDGFRDDEKSDNILIYNVDGIVMYPFTIKGNKYA